MSNKYTIRQRVAIAELLEVLSLIGRAENVPLSVIAGVLKRMDDILNRDAAVHLEPHEMTFHGMAEARRTVAQWIEKLNTAQAAQQGSVCPVCHGAGTIGGGIMQRVCCSYCRGAGTMQGVV